MLFKFNGVPFDDATSGEDGGDWSQVCKSCVSKYEIDSKHLDNVGHGICGVEGCNNESDHYIDFD